MTHRLSLSNCKRVLDSIFVLCDRHAFLRQARFVLLGKVRLSLPPHCPYDAIPRQVQIQFVLPFCLRMVSPASMTAVSSDEASYATPLEVLPYCLRQRDSTRLYHGWFSHWCNRHDFHAGFRLFVSLRKEYDRSRLFFVWISDVSVTHFSYISHCCMQSKQMCENSAGPCCAAHVLVEALMVQAL